MNVLALPSALAFTMNLTLCLIVLSDNPRSLAHRVFAGFVLSFALWNMGELIMIVSLNPVHAILGVRIILTGLMFAPVFFLHFSFVFPVKKDHWWTRGWKPLVFYLIPLAILVTFTLTYRIDVGRFEALKDIFYYGLRFEEPLLFLAFLVVMISYAGLCISWGISNLLQSLRTTRIPRQKLQIKYLIFGIVSMAFAGMVINLSNHFLQLGWPIFFLASLYSILVSLFFAIALIRYRLLDIHLLIRRGILYSVASGLTLAIYVLIIKNIGEMISRRAYGESIVVESLLILALVFFLWPFQKKLEDWIDHFFYMERVRYREKLLEFGRLLMELVDLIEIAKTTSHFITQTFHVEQVAILIHEPSGSLYRPIGTSPTWNQLSFASDSPLIKEIETRGMAMVLEHLRAEGGGLKEVDELTEKGWVVVAPFQFKDRILGLILLGAKQSGKDYTLEELDVLKAFTNHAGLAISRALLYQAMVQRDKQMMQVEKMVAIGELAAGIAHEIRNPLNVISGSAETLKKHEDPEIRNEMIGYILDESNRINGLITQLLDFARPKEPKLIECDLREVLDKTLLLLSPRAKAQGVQIQKRFPSRPLRASLDPDQISQAFMNLGVNAIEAMSGGGTLEVRANESDEGNVTVRFHDTGPGIPEEIKDRIFDPFFTTKKGGTGLGLSIAQQMVTQHGGHIFVEESRGRGSTFVVYLPTNRWRKT